MKRFLEVDSSVIGEEFQGVSQSILEPGPGGEITIETPAHLFKADFVRDGSDLVLKNNGVDDIRIVDYFAQNTPADLITANGARLTGETVEKLAGPMAPGQYAQAGQATGGEPIGQVETVEGGAQVQRADGTVEDLIVGMKVFQNDVVSTPDGAKLSVTFLDGTIFTLAASSRMVLDELVYSPGGDDNSATFSLIEGGFVFVAGQVAKTGDMEVQTPSATMGIRGTTVSANIATVDGVLALTVTLVEDFDGSGTGVIELRDLDGNLITTITETDSKWVVPLGDEQPYEVERTAADDAADEVILLDAANAFAIAYGRVDNGQNFVEQQSTSSTPSPTVDDQPNTLDGGTPDEGGNTIEGEGGSDGGGGGTTQGGQTTAPPTTGTDPTELDTNAPNNRDPEAPNTELVTDEDNAISGALPATDADGDTLTYTVETQPQNGTVTLLATGEFVYTPDENFNGEDSFTYAVTDGRGGETTASVTLNVDAVNDAPFTTTVEVTATEDSVFEGSVASSVSDAEGDSLTFSLFQVGGPTPQAAPAQGGSNGPLAAEPGPNDGLGPLNGVVVMQPDGSFTYTPDPNFSGEDFFTYQVTDAQGATAFETVSISVEGVNDVPVATNLETSTSEDTDLDATVAGQATDDDGDTLTFSVVAGEESGPQNGTVNMATDGSFTYTPDEDFTGQDSFTYQVDDGNGGLTTATVNITIEAENDAPVADNVAVSTDEDSALDGSVAGAASDVDGDDLTFALVEGEGFGPSNGTVTMGGDGSFTYTPEDDFNGQDSFTYQVDDGNGGTTTAIVTVTVDPANDDPLANDVDVSVDEDDAIEGSLVEETSDIDGDDLTFSLVTGEEEGPFNGDVVVNADGSYTYTPDADFNGEDSFTYQVDDGNGGITIASVTVTVDPVNDDPEANDVEVSVDEDNTLEGTLAEEAFDLDGDDLTFAVVVGDGEEVITGPFNGDVSVNEDGTYSYTPGENFNGTDSFTYVVDDGNGGTATGTVSITVNAVNDDPVIDEENSDLGVSGDEDNAITGTIVATDVDDDTLEFALAEGGAPNNGNLSLDGEGGYSYFPGVNFNGTDSFTVEVTDGNGGSTTVTVDINVDPVNDDPEIDEETSDLDVSGDEDTDITGTIVASDVDDDTLDFALAEGGAPNNGDVTFDEEGGYTYTPGENFNGTDSFTVEVTDGNGGSTTVTIDVTVDPVNDDPVIDVENSDLDVSGDEDTEITGTIVATDVDGDDLTFGLAESEGGGTGDDLVRGGSFVASEPTNGELTLNSDGSFTYVPDDDFNGTDSFDYEVSDGNGGTATGTVNITVDPVNDDPTAGDVSVSTDEDTDLEGSVASEAFDVDGDDLTFAVVQSGEEEEGDSGPSNGSVVMDEDGSFTYTPNANFNGTDSFTYVVDDGNGGTATGTVNITVNAVNDLPVADDLSFDGVEDDKVDGQVTATDADGDDLTFAVLTQPENGTVEMNADGTFTFFPEADFNGEVTFTYQVSDNGTFLDQEFDATVPQFGTVTIDLAPENDAPEADDQFFEVQADGEFTGQLIATDIDGDDLEFDPLTVPEQGELTLNLDGSFTFVPDEGASGFDTFQVQVLDGDLEVDVFEVTFAYGDSGGDVAEERGLDVEFNLTATEEAPAGSATITRSEVTATPINIVFALDASGSFSEEFGDQIDAVRATITALQSQFEGSSTPVTVQFTVFNGSATNFGPFDLFASGDEENPGINATLNAIETAGAGGSTSWVAALNAADGFYTDQEAELGEGVNILYFITDGQPTDTEDQIASALFNLRSNHSVDILAFGIGAGFDASALEQVYSITPGGATEPVELDFDSDNSAPVIVVDDLSGALQESPIFAAELTSFELSLQSDGEDQGVIADETSDAFEEQDLNFLLSLAEVDGIEDVLGDTNDFQAVAVFDTDGDLTTTEDQVNVVSSARIERPEEAVTESGLDGADLLVGGDFDDVLTGNNGNDMLIAGGGLDELRGGLGDDILVIDEVPASGTIVDGGAGGDDELNFTIGGDLTGILPTLTITEIEAIEIENGEANTLTLTSGDIAGLSDSASSEVEDIFEGYTLNTDDTVIVFGDDTDTLNLTADPGGIIIESGTETRGDESFTLYTFRDGVGDVTAVLAVDDDVTVNGVTPTF
ncbi:MAG: Ig-like domain-containing protein [Pseudomonadota bacterium]